MVQAVCFHEVSDHGQEMVRMLLQHILELCFSQLRVGNVGLCLCGSTVKQVGVRPFTLRSDQAALLPPTNASSTDRQQDRIEGARFSARPEILVYIYI